MISLGRVSRSVTTAAILFNAIFGANAAVAQLLTPSLTGQVETGGQYYYLEVYGPDQTYEYVRQRINPGEPVNGFSSSAAWNNQILSYSLGLAAFPMFGFGVKIPWSDQAFGTIYNVSYCLTGTGDLCTTREQNSLPTGLNLGWAYVQNAYPIIESGNVASGSGINKTSNLGQVLVPAFKGGTLVVDQTNQANNSNFSVDGSTTNTIDANGNNFTFAGVFSDELIGTRGSLRVVSSSPNSGFITFSGANTYTGLTTVSSGELSVMGSLQSDTSILPGGILSGSGVVNADVTNAGIVAPGRQGTRGTFTINGDYTQTSSGTLDLDVGGNGESDLLQINNGKVADLAGTVKISSLPGTSITPGIVYTGIATNPGVAYSGGSTAQPDTSSVVGASGYIFLREDDPGFQKLNNGTALVDSTKLQFGWLQLQPDAVKQPSDKKPPGTINPAATTPGQQSINQVKQKGGAVTKAITDNPSVNTATCTANSGNAAACQQINQPGSGSGASNANNVGVAKAIDAGISSVQAAAAQGISGGASINTNSGNPTGYTTNQTTAALVTPDFVTVYNALFSIPDRQQLNQALHSITAEPYASMQSVALEALEQFRANTLALTNGQRLPFIVEEQACEAPEPSDQAADKSQPQTDSCKPVTRQKLTSWSLLIDGSNTQASLNGTNDLASLDYNIFSSSYGLQYDFNRQWSAGAAFGYGRANLYNYEYSNTRIDSDTYSGAAWGIYRPSEAWKITALAGYMNLQYESDRNISFGGLNRNASANWSGNGFTSALAAEYDWILSGNKASRNAVRIKPSTYFSYALHNQGSFTESGAESLNLQVDSHTADSLIYGIGFTLETPIVTSKTSRLIPRLYVGYEYDFNGDTSEEHQLTASFAEVPALGSVDVLGQNRGANAVDVALSLEYETSDTLSLYGNVGGAFWSNGNEINYGAGLRLRW